MSNSCAIKGFGNVLPVVLRLDLSCSPLYFVLASIRFRYLGHYTSLKCGIQHVNTLIIARNDTNTIHLHHFLCLIISTLQNTYNLF